MSERTVTPETLRSLAAKIEGLDLTDAEQAVLEGVLTRAGLYEPDVEGFGYSTTTYTGRTSGAGLGEGLSQGIGIGGGYITRPSGWPPKP